MQDFIQKYHGLPSIGVFGKTGTKGERGNGIYFGYISDFFVTDIFSLSSLVRIAKVKENLAKDKTFVLNEEINTIKDHRILAGTADEISKIPDEIQGRYDINLSYHDPSLIYAEYFTGIRQIHLSNSMIQPQEKDIIDANFTDYDNDYVASVYQLELGIDYKLDRVNEIFREKNPALTGYEEIYDTSYLDRIHFYMPTHTVKINYSMDVDRDSDNKPIYYDVSVENKSRTSLTDEFTDDNNQFYYSNGNILENIIIDENLNNDGIRFASSDNDVFIEIPISFERYFYRRDFDGNIVYDSDNLPIIDELKVGDIIYFYTSKNSTNSIESVDINDKHTFTHMLIVDEKMFGQNLTYILNNATITDPFKFKGFSLNQLDGKNIRVLSNNYIALTTYEMKKINLFDSENEPIRAGLRKSESTFFTAAIDNDLGIDLLQEGFNKDTSVTTFRNALKNNNKYYTESDFEDLETVAKDKLIVDMQHVPYEDKNVYGGSGDILFTFNKDTHNIIYNESAYANINNLDEYVDNYVKAINYTHSVSEGSHNPIVSDEFFVDDNDGHYQFDNEMNIEIPVIDKNTGTKTAFEINTEEAQMAFEEAIKNKMRKKYKSITIDSLPPIHNLDAYGNDNGYNFISYGLPSTESLANNITNSFIVNDFIEKKYKIFKQNRNFERFVKSVFERLYSEHLEDWELKIKWDPSNSIYLYESGYYNTSADNPMSFYEIGSMDGSAQITIAPNQIYLKKFIEKEEALIKIEYALEIFKDFFISNFNRFAIDKKYMLSISQFDNNGKVSYLTLGTPDSENVINSINIFGDYKNIKLQSDVKPLKFSSLYVKNDTFTNSELGGVLFPTELVFDSEGYLPAMGEENYDESKYGFNLIKSNYIKDFNNIDNYSFGCIVIDSLTNESTEYMCATNEIKMFIPFDLRFKNETYREPERPQLYMDIDAYEYRFITIPFVNDKSGNRYFGVPDYTYIKVPKDGPILRSITHTNYDEKFVDQTDYINAGDITFKFLKNMDVMNETENKLILDFDNTIIKLKHIYINGSEGYDLLNYNIDGDSEEQIIDLGWIKFAKNGNEITNNEIKFSYTNNIPNIDSEDINDINDFICHDSFVNILENKNDSNIFDLIETNNYVNTRSREVIITVKYEKDGKEYTAYEYVRQPGYTESRVIPKVTLKPLLDQISLEKFNSQDKGVLCNQFQYFVELKFDGFDVNHWAKYTNNLTADVDIVVDNFAYDALYNNRYAEDNDYFSNLQVINNNKNDKKFIAGLDIAVNDNHIDYEECCAEYCSNSKSILVIKNDIANKADAATIDESDESDIETESQDLNELYYTIEYNDNTNLSLNLFDKKYYLFDDKGYKNFNEGLILHGTRICIKNIPLEALQNDGEPIKLRVFVDESNPLPSTLAMNFVVDKITINYTYLKENELITKQFNYNSLYNTEEFSTYMYNIPKYMTGIHRIYFNPLSYIALPNENSANKKLSFNNRSVMLLGSQDQPNIGLCEYNLQEIKKLAIEYSLYDNNKTNRVYSKYKNKKKINWQQALLKIRYLQDNISHIEINSSNPFDMFDIIDSNNIYKNLLHTFSPKYSIKELYDEFIPDNSEMAKNKIFINCNEKENLVYKDFVNILEFTDNIYGLVPYFSMAYHKAILKSKKRDDKNTFMFADKTAVETMYETDRYDQFDNHSKIFTSGTNVFSVRSQDLLDSMEQWNFEYVNSYKNIKENINAGIISEYGNGYNFLGNSFDTGQFGSKYMALKDVKNSNNKSLPTNLEYVLPIKYNELGDNYPKENNLFRVLLYSAKWEYPSIESDNSIFGFDIVDEYTTLLDILFLNIANNKIKDNYSEWLPMFGKSEDKVGNACGLEIMLDTFKQLKTSDLNEVKTSTSKTIFHRPDFGFGNDSILNNLKDFAANNKIYDYDSVGYNFAKFRQMIPYNLLFNVYPRIMYNDTFDVVNVFMLRCPVVGSEETNTIKRYFEIDDYEENGYPEVSQPYKF